MASHKIGIYQTNIEVVEPSYILGDVNGDVHVTLDDVNALSEHLLGRTPLGFISKAADVNKDGCVSTADLTLLIEMLQKK